MLRPSTYVLALALLVLDGCETVQFYTQAAGGQAEILSRQKPIRTALQDGRTPPVVRERLALTAALRRFAREELALVPSVTYTTYADLGREHVVFVVFAAPEFSIEPKSWWYPVVGHQDYRGFFAEDDARRAARALRKDGYDVYVGGVDAYSTLGWFRDPVLNTFADYPELEYVELIFHELTHHKLYIKGHTDFNEAFATAVAREGVRRWLRARNEPGRLAAYERTLRRRGK
ncbi:MAG: aminopeptidase, partial [Akkermansiaceae bacterium]|nr:aminopeptidase [Akkermansiaceae bacterium]